MDFMINLSASKSHVFIYQHLTPYYHTFKKLNLKKVYNASGFFLLFIMLVESSINVRSACFLSQRLSHTTLSLISLSLSLCRDGVDLVCCNPFGFQSNCVEVPTA